MFDKRVVPELRRRVRENENNRRWELRKEFLTRREEIIQKFDPGEEQTLLESVLQMFPLAFGCSVVSFAYGVGVADIFDGTLAGWWYTISAVLLSWLVFGLVDHGIFLLIYQIQRRRRDKKLRQQEAAAESVLEILRADSESEFQKRLYDAMVTYNKLHDTYLACENLYASVADELADFLETAIQRQEAGV